MAINRDGSSSKPGDWKGGGASGGGVYQEPGMRSSYDSKGSKLTGFNGARPGTPEYRGSGSIGNGVAKLSNMKLKNPIANLFRGGKGGPTGQIGSVNPALRTRRPGINQPVEEVSLPPPPAEIQEILNQNRPLTPAEQAMVNSWQRNAGNAFRWRTQARPGANWTPDPYTGPVPGAIPPNTGSGYNPNWNASGAVNQDQLKNSFSTPKYQQRVDHIAGGSAGGWPGAR